MIAVKFHGRGGQGAVVALNILAVAERLERAPPPKFLGGRNTAVICGELESILDRKNGGDSNLKNVRSRGQVQSDST